MLISCDRIRRKTLAANAVVAVTAGDEVTIEHLRCTVMLEAELRMRRIEVSWRYVLRFVNDLAACRKPGINQIFGDFGLSIDGHAFAAGKRSQVDPLALAVERNIEAAVPQALFGHPVTDTGFSQQVDRTLLDNAGPDSAFDIRPISVLENDRVDTTLMEYLREE